MYVLVYTKHKTIVVCQKSFLIRYCDDDTTFPVAEITHQSLHHSTAKMPLPFDGAPDPIRTNINQCSTCSANILWNGEDRETLMQLIFHWSPVLDTNHCLALNSMNVCLGCSCTSTLYSLSFARPRRWHSQTSIVYCTYTEITWSFRSHLVKQPETKRKRKWIDLRNAD